MMSSDVMVYNINIDTLLSNSTYIYKGVSMSLSVKCTHSIIYRLIGN